MNRRQRVLDVLEHRTPDRVPVDYWAQPEVTDRLMRRLSCAALDELLDRLGVDFRYIEGPRYIGPEPRVRDDGAVEDHFGVPRVKVQVGQGQSAGAYSEVLDFPLAGLSLEQIREYDHWPSPDWFNYGCVAEQAASARASGRAVVFVGDRTNRCSQLKPAMYLRGVEQILLDMAGAPAIAEHLFGRISEFYLEYARRTLEAGGGNIDIFMTGDDFGTQHGLLVSPRMWRQFLRPGFERFIRLGKSFGCRVAHHSCGSIMPIIPDMIDCGLDILNPIQPDVAGMEQTELKLRFGRQLTFHGSISIQRTLPFGTPADIQAEVRERFQTLGGDGGLIFCTAHNIQADTPIENVLALFDAYHRIGVYGDAPRLA